MLGCIVLVGLTSANADTPSDSPDAIVHAVQLKNRDYPDIVATVNERSISGTSLARRIYALQASPPMQSPGSQPDAADTVVQQALTQLIQEQVILSAAEDLGLEATTGEAAAFAKQQQQMFLTSDDPEVKEVYAAAAAQLGVSPEEFADQPEAVEVYRTALTRSNVYAWITNNLPEDQRNDPAAFQQALDSFIAQHTENVTILLGR